MIAPCAYEWERLRSLRLTWWLVVGCLVVTALAALAYGGVILGMRSGDLHVDRIEAVVLVVSKGSTANVAAGLLGVFAVGNEYRFGTLRTTLLVTPQRIRALLAKSIVVAGFGAMLAAFCLAVAWSVGALMLAGTVSMSVSMGELLHLLAAQIVLVSGWGLIGIALAAIVRSQVLALAVMLAVPFAVEPVLRTLGTLSGPAWLSRVATYLPFSAGEAMADISRGVTSTLLAPAASRADPLTGGMVFVAFIAVLGLAAVRRFRHQDV